MKIELKHETIMTILYTLRRGETECHTRENMARFTGNYDLKQIIQKQAEDIRNAIEELEKQLQ